MTSAALAPASLPGLHAALRSTLWSVGLVKFPTEESSSFLPLALSQKMGLVSVFDSLLKVLMLRKSSFAA